MVTRFLSFTVLAIVVLTGCGRQPVTVATGAAASPQANTRSAAESECAIEAARTVKLDDGTELRVWDLKLAGLKQLTAKLLIASDGKIQTANEIDYKWEAWAADAPGATGQLVLLVQDGKAFGAKDKRLPQMGLEIQGAPSQSMTGKKSNLLLTGELLPKFTTATQKQSLGKRNLVYAQLFTLKDKLDSGFSLTSDPERLAEASKEGRTVLAVELSWTGR